MTVLVIQAPGKKMPCTSELLEIKAVAVEVEDRLIPASPDVLRPALLSDARLKTRRPTHDDADVDAPLRLRERTE